MSRVITAAGGLVFRSTSERRRVLLIHRPAYDDWSFPKGKHDPEETDEDAALREIEEETRVIGRILDPIGRVEYETSNNNPKQVEYFAVRAIEVPRFRPNAEVDRLEWMSKRAALGRLTYSHDRELLESVSLERLDGIGEVHLVRHAAAGDRTGWEKPDHLRPLTARGEQQSVALAEAVARRRPDRIMSSPYVRCIDTARPLAERLGASLEVADFLEEGSSGAELLDFVAEHPGQELFMVSHGDVIPAVLDRLALLGVPLESRDPKGRLDCKKGSDWVLRTEGGEVVSAEYRPPPDM